MTKLQYVYVTFMENVIKESSLHKTFWTNPDAIQFLNNSVRFLTTGNLTLFIYQREFQKQFELSYSSEGSGTYIIDYSTISKMYSWAGGYISEYDFFENGGLAVLIGADIAEKEKWHNLIESSKLSVDNFMELHFYQSLYLTKVCIPTSITPEKEKALISHFEDYRRKINQREVLAEIQKISSFELVNPYFSHGESSLEVVAENERDTMFFKLRHEFYPIEWSEPKLELNNQTQELIARFYKS